MVSMRMVMGILLAGAEPEEVVRSPQEGWDFRLKDFVIAAWVPPAVSDPEFQLYQECGFNLVMSNRYVLPDEALDLAQKYGLMLVVDTYTPNDQPWGGAAGPYTPHPTHHPATLPELKWLHERYGSHPALAGYLLGDDYGKLPAELIETSAWMRENTPTLYPWICQNVFNPKSLADHGNPLANPQIYPTLYNKDQTPEKQAEIYWHKLDMLRRRCIQYDLTNWPMFNVSGMAMDDAHQGTASLVRFQVYASIAYGAQGIWYFTYRGWGSLALGDEGGKAHESMDEARKNLDPKWFVAREANLRVKAWGPELLGRTATEVHHAEDLAEGGLVTDMSDQLLVGILAKDDAPSLAMVVDKRVTTGPEDLAPREVEVTFGKSVKRIQMLSGASTEGRKIRLSLAGGEGQLLRLGL